MNKHDIDIELDDLDLDLPVEAENEGERGFSFNDLDLGLDFDLSFLDDVAEPPAPIVEAKEAPKAEPQEAAEQPEKPQEPKAEAPKKPVKKVKKPAEGAAAPARKPVKKAEGTEGKQPAAPAKRPMPDPDGLNKPKKPAAKTAAPKTPDQAAAPKADKKKKKKGPRVGGVIFYTLYFLFILAFFVATYFGLGMLKDWLADYELAQPTVKAQQVFDEVFTEPDWGALYVSAGAKDSVYEGKEEYVAYMEQKVGDQKLTYMETSAGLSQGKKYLVYLGNEKVASYTLTDKNKTNSTISLEDIQDLSALERMAEIPDWQLSSVEVFFERVGDYRIVTMDGFTTYVNDVPLDESFTIQKATTKAVDYLPEGTTGFTTCTQEVTGLMELPTVTVTDKDGNAVNVTYDEASRTFTARTESNTIIEDQQDVALNAAHVYCKWMIEEETDRGNVAKYFDPTSDVYNTIISMRELWMQGHAGYEFVDESVTDFTAYTDSIFSVKVKLNMVVTRKDGTTKDHIYDQSMFFHKVGGTWKCFESTNKDITEPVGLVRLTFMNGQTQLHSDFFDTSRKEIITPVVSVPEGQVFSGWVSISENEEGATVYNLEFQPDPTTGKVVLPDGFSLKPMTVYAFFEDADAVAAETVPAETAPAAITAEPVEPTAPAV